MDYNFPSAVSVDDMDINEIIELEELTDSSVEVLFDEGTPRGKTLRAVAYIVLKREYPDITVEEAGAFKLSIVMEALTEGEEGND